MIPLAIFNIKGNVDKTMITINLGFQLSNLSYRTIFVDLDPRNTLTQGLGINPFSLKGIEFLLTKDMAFNQILMKYSNDLHILPSGSKLKNLIYSLEPYLEKYANFGHSLLENALKGFNLDYDFLLIDCPSNNGILSLNALKYVRNVIIPVSCQNEGFLGLKETIPFIELVKEKYNPDLKILEIVPMMFNEGSDQAEKIFQDIKDSFPKLLSDIPITIGSGIIETTDHVKTIFEYNLKSRVTGNFKNLALEIIDRLQIY